MCAPKLAQHLQGAVGQWHVAILSPFPLPHVDHHPVAVDVSNLKVNAFTQAQTAGIDGAQASPVARMAYVPQDAAYLGDAEHHGQLLLSSWTHQVQRRPLPPERMLVEELDAA